MKILRLLFLIALVVAIEGKAKAQGLPSPVPCQQFFTATGQPLAGGFLYSYAAGTLTPQATYTDATLGTANANPQILNAGGFAVSSTGSCGIFLNPNLAYKFILQDSTGSQQWVVDNINTSNVNTIFSQANTWTALQTFSGGISVPSFTTGSAFNGACFLDGVTNTTLAQAVNCATGRGGKVWVPPSASNYSLNATVTLPAGIDLECLGSTGYSQEKNGPCTFSVAAGIQALEISGTNVKVSGLHFISQSSGAGVDDCIRIQGDYADIENTTCESFGRDGFRIDSNGGSNFADYATLIHDHAYKNIGDGFHWAASGVDENLTVCISCVSYNNTGYGFHSEQGNTANLIDPSVGFNTAGGYSFANSTAWNISNPYCETGTGSTFVMTSTASWFHVTTPFFGQCTTITNSGGLTNQYDYGTTGVGPQHNNILWGPDAGTASPTIFALYSGQFATSAASMHDVTNGVDVWYYTPSTKTFSFPTGINMGFQGQGSHFVTSNANSDTSGSVTISVGTHGSYTFTTPYTNPPNCGVTLLEPSAGTIPATGAWAYFSSATAIRVDVTNSGTYTFNFVCVGAPN